MGHRLLPILANLLVQPPHTFRLVVPAAKRVVKFQQLPRAVAKFRFAYTQLISSFFKVVELTAVVEDSCFIAKRHIFVINFVW